MFAFCPTLSRKNCGISGEDVPDTKLRANEFVQEVFSTDMRYRDGDQFTREYDACHYEINIDPFMDPNVIN